MLLLIAYAHKPPVNANIDVSSGARGQNFGQNLQAYIVYAIHENSGEPALRC